MRIYKLNTHKAFTDKENTLYNNKNKSELNVEISNNRKTRSIDKKYLYLDNGKENEKNQVGLFENFVVQLAVQDRGLNIEECPLIDEIIFLEVYHNEILRQIIDKGVLISGEKYIFFTATTGQVRNKTVTLIKKTFYDKHQEEFTMGLSKKVINSKGGINIGKYLAYNALSLSSSVLPEKRIDIDKCIVVPDLETVITDWVKYIDIKETDTGQCYIADMPKEYVLKPVSVKHTDGAGMFLPGELPSSCQIRGGYFKGAIFPFDFKKFTLEVAHNAIITDLWGKQVDIIKDDIRFIFTKSQLKMNEYFSSWDDYKTAFKKNNLYFSINSYANPAKDSTSFSYQNLQTLPFGCDVAKLCEASVNDIKNLCSDIDYIKEKMHLEKSNEDVANDSINSNIALAIDIYPQIIDDSYVKDKIRDFINARKKSYKAGKIIVNGCYGYAAPDLYAFCEFLFCKESNPKGLVPKNCVYNKYYDTKGSVEKLICLRSPHLSNYEYGKQDLIKSEKCKEWFQYMECDTVVSSHGLLSKTLQMDWDGDEILVCDDKELLKLAESLPDVPLYYIMQTAKAQKVTEGAIYDTLINGFENNVIGKSSNAITKLWNVPTANFESPTPYDDAINAICAYSNYAIDFPKTGKNLDMGIATELYKKLLPSPRLKSENEFKYPNFFIEAKGKSITSVNDPTNSVADRAKKYITEQTKGLRPQYFSKNSFNFTMLMSNELNENGSEKYKVNRYDSKYEKLYLLLKTKKQLIQSFAKSLKDEALKGNVDTTKQGLQFDVYTYLWVKEIKDIFTDNNGWFNIKLAVNYFVDMEYYNREFATTSKSILWRCFGHILVENLQRNVQGKVTIKQRPRFAYTKALKGNEDVDSIINQKKAKRTAKRTVDIFAKDLTFLETSLKHYKNGKLYSNDKELLFTFFCLYKEGKQTNRLKDGYLIITKKKHYTDYDSKSGTRKKKNITFNMNKILEISGARSYSGSLKRFAETKGIYVENQKDKVKIKFDLPCCCQNKLFTVCDIYNSMIYLKAYENKKPVKQCVICSKDFIKTSGNQKTCGSKKCQEALHSLSQAKVNERLKKQAV